MRRLRPLLIESREMVRALRGGLPGLLLAALFIAAAVLLGGRP